MKTSALHDITCKQGVLHSTSYLCDIYNHMLVSWCLLVHPSVCHVADYHVTVIIGDYSSIHPSLHHIGIVILIHQGQRHCLIHTVLTFQGFVYIIKVITSRALSTRHAVYRKCYVYTANIVNCHTQCIVVYRYLYDIVMLLCQSLPSTWDLISIVHKTVRELFFH